MVKCIETRTWSTTIQQKAIQKKNSDSSLHPGPKKVRKTKCEHQGDYFSHKLVKRNKTQTWSVTHWNIVIYQISVEYLHPQQRKVRKIESGMTDRRTDRQTDRQTDGWTEGKLIVPFSFAARELINHNESEHYIYLNLLLRYHFNLYMYINICTQHTLKNELQLDVHIGFNPRCCIYWWLLMIRLFPI